MKSVVGEVYVSVHVSTVLFSNYIPACNIAKDLYKLLFAGLL